MIQPKYVHIPMVLRFPKGFSLPGPAFPAYTAWGSHHLEGDTPVIEKFALENCPFSSLIYPSKW